MSHQEYVEKQKALVKEIAAQMLDGQIGIIEGARLLTKLQPGVTGKDFDEDFTIFVAIDTETDALPVGSERQYWADSALAKKDKEIQSAEELYREQALAGCRSLLEKIKAMDSDSK